MEINSLIVVYVRDLDKFQEMFDNDMTVGYFFKILQCSMFNVTRGREGVSNLRTEA